MHSFVDNKGRSWTLEVNCYTLGLVRKATDVDLSKLDPERGLLLADPVRLCGVLWALVEEQAKAAGVTAEDFGRGLSGQSIAEATEALFAAVVDLFPSSAREALNRAFEVGRQVQEAARLQILERLADPNLITDAVAALTKPVDLN